MNFYRQKLLPALINFAMGRKDLEKMRPSMVGKASGVVLEIGFGLGYNLVFYKNVKLLYALEPSKELYKKAQSRIGLANFPIKFIESSAEKIPLENNSVDFVVSTWSLCSIPNVDLALKEVARVLKNEGKFVFLEHGVSENIFLKFVQKFLTPASKIIAGGCCLDRRIDEIILNAGFEFENLEKIAESFRPLRTMYQGVAVLK